MTNKLAALVAAALFTASMSAHAGIVHIGTTAGVQNPTHTENFESGAVRTDITNQFSDNGLTFKNIGTNGMVLTSWAVCNNLGGHPTNKYVVLGLKYPCQVDTALNAVSVSFAEDVSELSWTGFNRTIGNGYTIQALLDGKVVSETSFHANNKFDKEIVHFTGSVFDEIRFTEASVWQGYFGFDDMAWKTATAQQQPSEVPLPGTLALLGIGMLGIGMKRKSRTV